MSQKTNHNYYDTDGHFVGEFEKNPQNIKFHVMGGIHVHDAVLASIDITKQYKQPVCLIFNGVKLDIKYTGKEPSVQNILAEYNKKVAQKYRG